MTLIHVTENGRLRVGTGPRRIKYYHFDLTAESKSASPFIDGMIYIADAADIPERQPYPLLIWFEAEIEEWGSANAVTPSIRLPVKLDDFP